MRLTTKGRYAVTAMVDIAVHGQAGDPIPLNALAERQGIPVPYLEQIACRLKKAGLIASTRGAHGGYRLAKEAQMISIADIVRAADEILDSTQCQGLNNCKRGTQCLTHHLWEDLNQVVLNHLSSVSLAHVRESISKKESPSKVDLIWRSA